MYFHVHIYINLSGVNSSVNSFYDKLFTSTKYLNTEVLICSLTYHHHHHFIIYVYILAHLSPCHVMYKPYTLIAFEKERINVC